MSINSLKATLATTQLTDTSVSEFLHVSDTIWNPVLSGRCYIIAIAESSVLLSCSKPTRRMDSLYFCRPSSMMVSTSSAMSWRPLSFMAVINLLTQSGSSEFCRAHEKSMSRICLSRSSLKKGGSTEVINTHSPDWQPKEALPEL